MDPLVVGEQVVSIHGNTLTIRRYLKGWHPELGQLHWGLSGPETVVESTIVRLHKFFVGTSGVHQVA